MSRPVRFRGLIRSSILAALFLGSALHASRGSAAGPRSRDKPTAPGIQRERVTLVLIDVVVTDKKGRQANDLRPDEFSLKVDGDDHRIDSVEFHLSGEEAPATVPPISAEKNGEGRAVPGGPPVPLTPRLSPRHFLLFFDALNSERGLRIEVVNPARKFLESGLKPGDQAMVAGQGRGLKIYQEFTDDRAKMVAALDALAADSAMQMAGENQTRHNLDKLSEEEERTEGQCPQCIDTLAKTFVQGDRDRIIRTLASLKALVAYLRAMEGRKDLIFLTDGFPEEPGALYGVPDETAIRTEVLALSREAASAQVALHTVNTLGVPGMVAGEMRGHFMTGRTYKGPPVADAMERQSTHTLSVISINTGGLAIHGTNKFEEGLSKIEQETRSSYVVAFTPTGEPDGKFHAVRVIVARKGLVVRAREGFVFLADEQIQEREILSAYMAPELYHDIPVLLDTRIYLAQGEKPAVEVAMVVPQEALLLQPREGQYVARVEAGVTFQSGKHEIVDHFSRATEARLRPADLSSSGELTLLAHRPIPPGEYEAVAVVRDLGTGKIGAVRLPVKVPSLPGDRIAMSSLVLAHGQGTASPAWVDLDETPKEDAGLVVPTVRRIFPRTAEPVGTSRIYHPRRDAGTGEARIRVLGSIRRGNETVKDLPSLHRVFTSNQTVEAIPVEFPLPLSELGPGVYTLHVQALDEVAGSGIHQSLDFMVR